MLARSFGAALAILLVSTSCADSSPRQAEAPVKAAAAKPAGRGPALWVVKDSDTTIYLFGTVHMLPKGFSWQSDVVDKAFDAADTVVFEVVGVDDPNVTGPVVAELGFTPGQPPLAERVPEAERAKLAEAVRAAGVPPRALDAMETWLATMTLATARIITLGYGADSGVEAVLKAKAIADRKRIEGLETVREQLGFFDTLSEDQQRELLVASLDDMDEIEELIATTVKDWAAGDVEKVAAALESDISASPVLAKRLLADRNENWAEWVEQRLATTPGVVFMAVGTGHLAGKDSLQAKLRERGLHSVRLN